MFDHLLFFSLCVCVCHDVVGCEDVMRMAAEMQGRPVEGPWARTED